MIERLTNLVHDRGDLLKEREILLPNVEVAGAAIFGRSRVVDPDRRLSDEGGSAGHREDRAVRFLPVTKLGSCCGHLFLSVVKNYCGGQICGGALENFVTPLDARAYPAVACANDDCAIEQRTNTARPSTCALCAVCDAMSSVCDHIHRYASCGVCVVNAAGSWITYRATSHRFSRNTNIRTIHTAVLRPSDDLPGTIHQRRIAYFSRSGLTSATRWPIILT